jgi:fluoroacetyl-CoA thioesterase
MKPSLKKGLTYSHRCKIDAGKCVPALYPEADEFKTMPEVFATGYMIGFIEWTCILALMPHIDWPAEQSVGTHIDVSHQAATPPGLTVTATVKLVEVDGRHLVFDVEAFDGVDTICRGRHERFLIDRAKFDRKLAEKAKHGAPT